MEKNWVIKQQGDEKHVKHLQEALSVDKSLANILVQRGITNYDEAKAFFRPELSNLHDPFLMMDMDIRRKIVDCGTEAEIRAMSREKGHGSLLDSGVNRMLDGLTTADEVLRVTFADR